MGIVPGTRYDFVHSGCGGFAVQNVRFPLLIGHAVEACEFEFVVTQYRSGVDHAIGSIIDGHQQQIHIGVSFMEHGAGIAHNIVARIGVNVSYQGVPQVAIGQVIYCPEKYILIEQLWIPTVPLPEI